MRLARSTYIANAPALISSPSLELNDIRVVGVKAALRIQAFSGLGRRWQHCKLLPIIRQRGQAQNPRSCVDRRLTGNLHPREICRRRGHVYARQSIFLLAQVQPINVFAAESE